MELSARRSNPRATDHYSTSNQDARCLRPDPVIGVDPALAGRAVTTEFPVIRPQSARSPPSK